MKVGEITYDELPKEMLFTVVSESDVDLVIEMIMKSARSGAEGAYGDGKIFVSPIERSFTISSGRQDEVVEEATAWPRGIYA